MIISQNIGALCVQRQLGINNNFKMKSTAKLSSGYKINKAADDAAGLTISETMRRQIRGLDQGLENMQDGISLCQVADGALNEVHAMLDRMTELVVQAANGTNSDSDREAINLEVESLKEEINRIGSTTKFNEQIVFKGEGTTTESTLENPTAKGPFFELLGSDASNTGFMQEPLKKEDLEQMPNTGMNNQGDAPYVGVHVNFDKLINQDNNISELAGTEFYVNCCTNCCATTIKFTDEVGISKDGKNISVGVKKADGTYFTDANEFCDMIVNSSDIAGLKHVEFAYKDSTLYMYDIDNNEWEENEKEKAYFCDEPGSTSGTTEEAGGDVIIQMSGEASDNMALHIGTLSTKTLHIDKCDCLTCDNAREMISAVKEGSRILSSQRSRIGAYTNSLEHASSVNANTHENTTAAESRIRDTDMAKTMVEHAKYNILEQAGQAMLAQVNKAPERVLSLLQ